MAKLSKRAAAIAAKIDRNKLYPVSDALNLIKETATAKFDESVDVAVQLGIDPRKSDQLVRGSVVLPAGTGKSVRVAVFAQGEKAEEARDELKDAIEKDELDLIKEKRDALNEIVQDLTVKLYEQAAAENQAQQEQNADESTSDDDNVVDADFEEVDDE